jgi:hypothetical protein
VVEFAPLLDYPDLGGEQVVVKHAIDPLRKVVPIRMRAQDAG